MNEVEIQTKLTKNLFQKLAFLSSGLIICIVFMGIFLYRQTAPPDTFQTDTRFEITTGMTVRDIAHKAQAQGIVRSDILLYALLTYSYDPTTIFAGTYLFKKPLDIFGVANKLANKDIENNLFRITVPEGITRKDIALIAQNTLSNFSQEEYLTITSDLEGYLYPETYFVPETFTADDLVQLQLETFHEIVDPLQKQINASQFSLYQVLILASLIEREANSKESMQLVSSVLQNRLAIDMPLQADASLEYILDKPLSELTAKDLKIQSPYNTYLNTGLMPTPIGNPGLQAIQAVLEPAESDYLFYITDPKGNFHYAKTFAEHNKNIAKYLR